LFNQNVFGASPPKIEIPEDCQIVFVSDLFAVDHLGGAELTTDAIITSSPYSIAMLHSKNVSLEILEQGHGKHWIFGNFASMDLNLIPTIIGNMNYSIVEYDYKYCRYRSPEKHASAEGKPCDCNNEENGKLISAFYYGAKSLWWMSVSQMQKYHEMFPFLASVNNAVLSSVFDENFFAKVKDLTEKAKGTKREKWLVIGSTSWIKGTQDAEAHCQENDLDYETVWNLSYDDMLEKMSQSEGLVFLPKGADTCPRTVIEAKLLGCSIITNENTQHATEPWFSSDDPNVTFNYLYSARNRFWSGIKSILEYNPTLSGYTTTYNCVDQRYPFVESIESLLDFCDQVVVVDGGSSDGTWEQLQKLSEKHQSLIIHQQTRDWSYPRFAVFDGLQKALARSLCTGEFCWQQDSDEIIHEDDYEKIKMLMREFPKNIDLLALPVIEYWGGSEKVRMDVTPWKWRISRNRPHITHGIPAELRVFDEEGRLHSKPGTDGCDYIRSDTFEPIPFANFYSPEVHELRLKSFEDSQSLSKYEEWIGVLCSNLPCVHHYSWFDLKRKIRTYRDYWSKHWQSLYDIEQEDTAENNMFFNKPWSEVEEDEIDSLAERLEKEMGGWIFHNKVDFNKPTPWMTLDTGHPKVIWSWMNK